MPAIYSHCEVEKKWYKLWEEKGCFSPSKNSLAKPYCIVIPPPNVTGILHMGHALNNAIQDILIRKARMDGKNTLWIPGTDHAGIATQNVVEKELSKQGIKREDLGREAFVKKVWEWKEHYQKRITDQLCKLGCSCDWSRERFTMEQGLSMAVRIVFVHLYKKGLIYKGKYIINWCPRCGTALSDEEAEYQEGKGHLWHIKYPFKEGLGHIEIATTRPETMLGDTAVAVNPKDKRYSHLIGKILILPIINREIPLISDDYVDMEFGTGALKITPAHDPYDFEIGNRHNLERVTVIAPDGRMNENAGRYKGMDRFECRGKIVEELKIAGLLVKISEHLHAVGHCYRCDSAVEPYLSDQWFVKMKPLSEPACRAAETQEIRFFPKTETKKYLDWMHNIRDWCISRQLWWGHQIPAWYCAECGYVTVSILDPEKCEKCQSVKISQDQDVLDTWFSSWLWPFSTMGWPAQTDDLKAFYPTTVLATAPDIIFFWVARMIMAGYEFTGKKPFSDVYIHGVVRDDKGRKMSKSLGNSIDPLQVIQKYGADAMRFTLVANTPQGKDVYLKKEKLADGLENYPTFEVGRNFCNKLWNVSRFVFQNIEGFTPAKTEINSLALGLPDRWILSRLAYTCGQVESNFEKYRLNDVAQILFHFVKDDFCDWYVEIKKHVLYGNPTESQAYTARFLLLYVLSNILKMMHPIIPFLTEEIWSCLPQNARIKSLHDREYLITACSFKADISWMQPSIDRQFEMLQNIVTAIRRMRKESEIPLGEYVNIHIRTNNESQNVRLEPVTAYIKHFGKVKELIIDCGLKKKPFSKSEIVSGIEIFLILHGFIDIEQETKKKEKKIEEIRDFIQKIQTKLQNHAFQTHAPKHVIDKERDKLKSAMENLEKTEKALKDLETSPA